MAAKSRSKLAAAAKSSTTAPPAKTLLQLVKETPPPRPASFLDKLAPETAAEFLALRAAYHGKKLPAHMTPTRIYRDVISAHHPDVCSEATFRKWMNVNEARNG